MARKAIYMLDHTSKVSFLGAIILFLRCDIHIADPFRVKGINKRFSSKDISKRNPFGIILIHDTLEDTEVKESSDRARLDLFEGHGGGGNGVAHGEKVSVARDERNIFFTFFTEFFCPFRSMIAKSFKAASGSDQFSDPVGSDVRLRHGRKIAQDREPTRKKIIIAQRKRGGVFLNDCRFCLTANEEGGGEHYQIPFSRLKIICDPLVFSNE